MQEQAPLQNLPVKVYRTHDHLTVAAPMPGLEPEDILVEVTENGQLILPYILRHTIRESIEKDSATRL
jgi:HSP20 family protein